VLFSRQDVANYVNRNFEPAWEMVRPVPVINIDFGNGLTATRTLHGNVATYVCCNDGQVVDILPGMYTPPIFLSALDQQKHFMSVTLGNALETRNARLRDYHRTRAEGLRTRPQLYTAATSPAPQPRPGNREVDRAKKTVELRVEAVVRQGQPAPVAPNARPRAGDDLAVWSTLAADTWRNETQRRIRIHDHLATAGSVRPEQVKRWLYKEILEANLDDPYLGLGDTVFGDDVFRQVEGSW
jgi:hypothetical protein